MSAKEMVVREFASAGASAAAAAVAVKDGGRGSREKTRRRPVRVDRERSKNEGGLVSARRGAEGPRFLQETDGSRSGDGCQGAGGPAEAPLLFVPSVAFGCPRASVEASGMLPGDLD